MRAKRSILFQTFFASLLLSLIAFVFAGCAHRAASNGKLLTASPDDQDHPNSPDGKWAVGETRSGGDANPHLWFGVVDRHSGRHVFTIAERDPNDPDSFDGQVDLTAWSPDSQFVVCRLHKAHYVDNLVLARFSAGKWNSVAIPSFDLGAQYEKLQEVQLHYTQQTGGDWIESLKWTDNHRLRVSLDTTLDIDGPAMEKRRFRFSADADIDFAAGRPQVRWSPGSLSAD